MADDRCYFRGSNPVTQEVQWLRGEVGQDIGDGLVGMSYELQLRLANVVFSWIARWIYLWLAFFN